MSCYLTSRQIGEDSNGEKSENGKILALRGYEEQVLLVCAVRYAMGRHTYMPSLVCGVIREHIEELDPSVARTMARDIREEWLTWFGPQVPNAELSKSDTFYGCDWGCFVELLPALDKVACAASSFYGGPELPVGLRNWEEAPEEIRWRPAISG